MIKEVNVHIGEVKIVRNGETLRALLGSCIGVGFIWEERQLCGLAHCLLPKNPHQDFKISGRFVDQAIASLIALMKIRKHDHAAIKIIIAGGGNITDSTEDATLIGKHNSQMALQTCEHLGLKIHFLDIGGNESRRINIHAHNFSYTVEKIPKILQAS